VILLAVFSLLVGAVLAQRFKIMVLLPATALVLMTAAGTGVLEADTFAWTLLIAAAGSASLQVGYVFGMGLGYVLAAPSAKSPQPLRASTSARTPAQTTPRSL